MLDVARAYKRRNIPLSVMVIDYFHWTEQGERKFDPERWPAPEAMARELEDFIALVSEGCDVIGAFRTS